MINSRKANPIGSWIVRPAKVGVRVGDPIYPHEWAREAAKFVPHLKVLVQHGSNRLKETELVKAAESADLVITSYGTMARDPTRPCPA